MSVSDTFCLYVYEYVFVYGELFEAVCIHIDMHNYMHCACY